MRILVAAIIGVTILEMLLLAPLSTQAFRGTPEPISLLLAGAALVCLGIFTRKRILKRTKRYPERGDGDLHFANFSPGNSHVPSRPAGA